MGKGGLEVDGGSTAERVEKRYCKLQEGWNEKYSTLGYVGAYTTVTVCNCTEKGTPFVEQGG